MKVIAPGDPAHSAVMHRITATDPKRRMSFGCEPLDAREVQRGMLDETLVIWGGEFGRTAYGQFSSAVDTQATANSYGRDHNPRCYTV